VFIPPSNNIIIIAIAPKIPENYWRRDSFILCILKTIPAKRPKSSNQIMLGI
jgi:hypothetical protein